MAPPKYTPDQVRASFWNRIDQSAGPASCHPWRGAIQAGGRAYVSTNLGNFRAYRFAWIDTFGPIPDGLEVCHTCDNPRCCNTSHLYLGTHAENMNDMAVRRRGTGPQSPVDQIVEPDRLYAGSRNGRARLHETDVLEIRRAYAAGETRRVLADRYGVALNSISDIVNRRRWRTVP